MKVYYKENTGMIGVKKFGNLNLDFIVPFRMDVNPKTFEEDNVTEIDSNETHVHLRFHSSLEIALSNPKVFHARLWVLEGVDYTYDQIEKLLQEEFISDFNNENIDLRGSKVVYDTNK